MGLEGVRGPFQDPTHIPDLREIPKLRFVSFQNVYSFAQYPGTRHFPYNRPITRGHGSAHYLGLGCIREPFQDPTQEPDEVEFPRPTL